MSERVKFVAAHLRGEDSFTDLCRDFGISRKTGYKWLRRFETEGPAALKERSRAPHGHPQATPEHIVEAIASLRRRHPRWGPKKLRVVLLRRHPRMVLPATSTVGEILKRCELTRPRRRIRRSSPYGDRLRQYDSPNTVWCADFKGHFAIGGDRCYPLTISDGFSRYLRRHPGYLTHMQYPAHFETRRAYPNGVISLGATQWYVSACVAGQRIGLEPIDGGGYRVYFGSIALGLMDPRRFDERRERQFGRLIPIRDDSPRRRRPYRR